jgi:hypothetical protein
MTTRQLAALLGFAFVAAWIALNFGYALLCLIGAGAFYVIASVLENDIDLGALQARVTQRPLGSDHATAPSAPRRTRVQ